MIQDAMEFTLSLEITDFKPMEIYSFQSDIMESTFVFSDQLNYIFCNRMKWEGVVK